MPKRMRRSSRPRAPLGTDCTVHTSSLNAKSGNRGLSLRGTCHTAIGLCRSIHLIRVGSEHDVNVGALRKWDFVAVGVNFVRFHIKLDEIGRSKAGRDGDVGCIATGSHEDSTEARIIVPGIEIDPLPVQEHLVPGAEVATTTQGLANVTNVARDITCWDIHATGESNGEVLEISANPNSFDENVGRGFCGSRGVVVKRDLVVHPIADRDGPLPARFLRSELIVSDRTKLVDLAIPARKQKLEDFGGKVIDRHLFCIGVLTNRGNPLPRRCSNRKA